MSRPDAEVRCALRNRGFSLPELVVVLAVLGLLYAIVSPRYQQFVLRANRTEGQALLVDAAARQARHYALQHTYVTHQADIDKLQLPKSNGSHVTSLSGLYRLDVASGDGGYLLQAVPLGAQVADRACASLLLDGTGNRGMTGTGSLTECWK